MARETKEIRAALMKAHDAVLHLGLIDAAAALFTLANGKAVPETMDPEWNDRVGIVMMVLAGRLVGEDDDILPHETHKALYYTVPEVTADLVFSDPAYGELQYFAYCVEGLTECGGRAAWSKTQ